METYESYLSLYVQLLVGALAVPLAWDTLAPDLQMDGAP